MFAKKNIYIPIPILNNNLNGAPNKISYISPNNNINNNSNNNGNIYNNNNNNTKGIIINKEKLNDLFVEEKEELEKNKEENIKVNQEQKDNENSLELSKVVREITNVEKDEIKETNIEKVSSQPLMNGISPEKKDKIFNNNQNKIFKSLFDEKEKNNSEEDKPAEPQKIQPNLENKKKLKALFDDDDD